MRGDTRHEARQHPGMDSSIPDFGDVVGLTRLYRPAVERIRWSDMTEGEKVSIIGMIEEEYRAARAAALSARTSSA
ncbi:MAG: hypothetical protein H6Q33_4262 [Deltaproteobacteria bacterium]|nr:hypothetical protein [Deltaproteobacteria bacterium]